MSLVRAEDVAPPRLRTRHEHEDAVRALYSRAPRNANALALVREVLTRGRQWHEEKGDER